MPEPIESKANQDATRFPLSLRKVVYALSDETRWEILAVLVDGEPRMVNDLARRTGNTRTATSKHLKALRVAGVVEMFNRLHRLKPRFRPVAGTRQINLGRCILCFD